MSFECWGRVQAQSEVNVRLAKVQELCAKVVSQGPCKSCVTVRVELCRGKVQIRGGVEKHAQVKLADLWT